MPFYDLGCQACDWREIDALEPVNRAPRACPSCGADTMRVWTTTPPTAIGDEMDHVQVNGCTTPIRFTSKIERQRWMKEHGYRDATRHVGEQGTDKSKHTRSWGTLDPYTANNVRILLERAFKVGTTHEDELKPLAARAYSGDVDGPEYRQFLGKA